MNDPTRIYHEVRLATGGTGAAYLAGDKETVSFTYKSEWRGRDVRVDMVADRYVHSSGWSEWRIHAAAAREWSESSLGDNLTETARSRLSDQLRPDVEAWLASDQYGPSESRAYVAAIRRDLSDMRGGYSADRIRQAVSVNLDKIGPAVAARFESALAAYETFSSLVDEIAQ